MDYEKFGNFLTAERKAKNLTQAKLAEKLFVSEKTVSKWENGKSLPDTDFLPKLCEIFGISVNELLNGERFSGENYMDKAEKKLLDLKKEKEESDKRLLTAEIIIGILGVVFLYTTVFIAAFADLSTAVRIFLIVLGFAVFLAAIFFALKIEQQAGFYVCEKCQNKYIPSYKQVLFAPHVNRTRYMKCPRCKKKSWHKKVIG